jgi:hypothetical protein
MCSLCLLCMCIASCACIACTHRAFYVQRAPLHAQKKRDEGERPLKKKEGRAYRAPRTLVPLFFSLQTAYSCDKKKKRDERTERLYRRHILVTKSIISQRNNPETGDQERKKIKKITFLMLLLSFLFCVGVSLRSRKSVTCTYKSEYDMHL